MNSRNNFIQEISKCIREDVDLAGEFKKYATIFKTSYAPLFSFRDSLFQNIRIHDPNNLLLDNIGETNLDPMHLLRFYEFESNNDYIEIKGRAKIPYDISFALDVPDYDEFWNTRLNKLYAFENCHIRRTLGGAKRPTPRIHALEKQLIPGVIVSETAKNRWARIRLGRQGLDSFPICVSSHQLPTPKQYRFFPSLSGILALASAGVALTCPDEEDFYIV